MPRYVISVEVMVERTYSVDAESESAARQAFAKGRAELDDSLDGTETITDVSEDND